MTSDTALLAAYDKYCKKSPLCIRLQNRGCSIVKAYNLKFEKDFMTESIEPEQCLNYPNSFIEVIRENEQFKSYIDEGLIKTYPLENAVRWHRELCKKHLTRSQLAVKAAFKNSSQPTAVWKEFSFANVDKPTGIAGLLAFYMPIDDMTDITSLVDEVTSWHNVTGYDLSEHSVLVLAGENR